MFQQRGLGWNCDWVFNSLYCGSAGLQWNCLCVFKITEVVSCSSLSRIRRKTISSLKTWRDCVCLASRCDVCPPPVPSPPSWTSPWTATPPLSCAPPPVRQARRPPKTGSFRSPHTAPYEDGRVTNPPARETIGRPGTMKLPRCLWTGEIPLLSGGGLP